MMLSAGATVDNIDQEQELHDVVRRCHRGLDDEHIPSPGIPVDPDENLAVGEVVDVCRIDLLAEELSDLVRQGPVRSSGKDEHRPSSVGVVHSDSGGPGLGSRRVTA